MRSISRPHAKWPARRRAGPGWRSAQVPTAMAQRSRRHGRQHTVERLTQASSQSEARARQSRSRSSPAIRIEHALMTQAAMQALPAAPVAPPSTADEPRSRQAEIPFDLIKPGGDGAGGPSSRRSRRALDLGGVTVIHVTRPARHRRPPLARFCSATPSPARSQASSPPSPRIRWENCCSSLHRDAVRPHQHASHDVRQCAMMMQTRPRSRRAAATLFVDGSALEPHHGRQRVFNPVLTDRRRSIDDGRPDAGPIEETCAIARDLADLLRPMCPRLRALALRWKRRRAAAASSGISG